MDLPRELRDIIFWLAVQNVIDPKRDIDLVSRPGPTIRALARVSHNVRVEAASIYWSRAEFSYSTHNLLRDETLGDYRGRFKLKSWLGTWGRLAVPRVRRLELTLPFDSGGLDIQISKHARPSIGAWTHDGLGAEESLRIIVKAVLFPDGHSTMTPETLEKVCEFLYEVGRMLSPQEWNVIPWMGGQLTLNVWDKRWYWSVVKPLNVGS
jgi:hypothetical protein